MTSGLNTHWLTPARVMAYSKITLAAFVTVTAGVFIAWFSRYPGAHLPFVDFSVYWASAHFALQGQADRVFDLTAFCGDSIRALMPILPCGYPWLYPPAYFLWILPLALIPFWPAFFAFTTLNVSAYVAVISRTIEGRAAFWASAAFPGLWMNLLSGQNGCVTAALAGGALMIMQRQPALSGFLIGSLIVKPQLGILFPVALVAARAWRTIAVAAATAVAWMLAGVFLLGRGAWYGWLEQLDLARHILDGTRTVYLMPTAFGFFRMTGLPVPYVYGAQAVVSLMAACAIWIIWRRGAPAPLKHATLMVGIFLASPYLLDYDMAWLALPLAWLARWGITHGWHRGERELLAAAWISPLLATVSTTFLSTQLAFPVLLMLFLLILRKCYAAGMPLTSHDRPFLAEC